MCKRQFEPISIPAAGAVFKGLISRATETSNREIILAFHGYARPASDFELFLPLLKPHQELVSLGLFGHETSTLPASYSPMQTISEKDFRDWMEALIDHFKVQRVHLLTYSMGGRIALKTAELLPDRIGKMLLTAPDGFRDPWVYNPVFGTALGRRFYEFTVHHPGWVFTLACLFTRLKLMHPKTEKFAEVHFGTLEKRLQLREVWSRYRSISPNRPRVAKYVREKRFELTLIFGERDSVIPPKLGKTFERQTGLSIVYTIHAGHQLLTPALVELLREKDLWF